MASKPLFNRSVLTAERLLVLVVVALVLAGYWMPAGFARWEVALVDAASVREVVPADESVTVVAIDQVSIDKLGGWPLSRDLYARLIDRLAAARVRTVVLMVPLDVPQVDPGLAILRRMKGLLAAAASGAPVERRLSDLVEQAEEVLDVDGQLARSMATAGSVLLTANHRIPLYTSESSIPQVPFRSTSESQGDVAWPVVSGLVAPAAELGLAAVATGHAILFRDRDGVVRREALWVTQGGRQLPSVALLAAARAKGLKLADPAPASDRALAWGPVELVPDMSGLVHLRLPGEGAAGRAPGRETLHEVLAGKVPASRLAGRTVFVGLTAPGLASTVALPGQSVSEVERLAQVCASLLGGHLITSPVWSGLVGWIMVLCVIGLLLFVASQPPSKRWVWSSLGATALALPLIEYVLLSVAGLWVPLVLAALILLTGVIALQVRDGVRRHVHVRFRSPLEEHADPVGVASSASRAGATGREARMAGRKLGPYRIGRLIGKGGKASVYRAIDTRSQTQVALKLLDLPARYAGADWQGAQDRFLHEARAAGHLRHPNIVQILDSGVQDGMAYIAMEYLGGQDLGAWCRPGHLLPLTLTLSIAARIGQALAFAHRQQVVHRDVKPANILYDRDSDTLKVTDFGIAHLGGSRSSAGDAARTPGYMSPEQCAGTAVDLRSDLYSLGVTLYQMLTGVLPLVGESLAELERRIATEDAPDIRTLNPNLPQPLAELVARLLNKQPDRRYQDGDDVAQDLYRLAAELGQQAAQDPFSDSGFGFAPTQIEAPDGAAPTPVRGGSAGAGVRTGGQPGKSP